MADKTNNIIYRIEVDSKSGKLNIDGVTKSFEDADRAVLKLQSDIRKGTQGASKEMNQLRSASGGATTSVLELGRVVSDAPYGIRGMANNISQLASNMLFTSQQIDKTTGKAIGFKGVLKDMGKSFMGPLGILFAIQAVVAAVDYFYGSATKAAGAGKEFELSAEDLSGTLRDLHGTQEEVNDKIDEYITLMMKKRAVAKEDAESNQKISKLDKIIDDAKAIMFNNDVERLGGAERLTKQQIALANKTYNAQKEILTKAENDRVEEFKAVIKRQQEIEDLDKKMKAAREGTLKSLKNLKKEKEKERELNADSAEEYKRLTVAIDEYQRKIEEIEGKKTKGSGKAKKISPFKTPKELDIDIKNVDKALLAYEKKTRDSRLKEELNNKLSQAKSEEERKLIRDAYASDKLESELKAEGDRLILAKETEEEIVKDKYNTHITQLKNAKELYEFKIKNDPDIKNKEELLKKLNSTHKSALKQAKDEFDISMSEIQSNFELISVAFEDYSESRRNSLNSGGFGSSEDPKVDPRIAKIEDFLSKYMKISGVLNDFMNAEFEREMTIEQNKTNSLNNELRERLNNENLSAGERKNIQLEIARNDEALRKKQEKIEKKRFKFNKAMNIANALVETYSSASKAYLSQLSLPTPDAPVRAKVAAGVATAFGLANVAMIARQKFQSSAGATTPAGALGGGGSGGADRSFNFNLAGASQENQLAQTLQSQFDQPIQTYVVARDITNQQQLDQDILSNASFG